MPGDRSDQRPFAEIGRNEKIVIVGITALPNASLSGETLSVAGKSTDKERRITVGRFAGRGGLSFSGRMADGTAFDAMVTAGACRTDANGPSYPFNVTVRVGDNLQSGCGWTDARPYQDAGGAR